MIWTIINPQAMVQIWCFWSISLLPTRHKVHQGENGLPLLCLGIRRQKGPVLLSGRKKHRKGIGDHNQNPSWGWPWRNLWCHIGTADRGTATHPSFAFKPSPSQQCRNKSALWHLLCWAMTGSRLPKLVQEIQGFGADKVLVYTVDKESPLLTGASAL